MPTGFSRSLRSVEADGGRLGRWLALPVLVIVALWGWWMVAAEVPLHAASTAARLVRERAVHALQSTVDGRVLAVHVALDQAVQAGELLLELDASAQELAREEELARVAALDAEIAASLAALDALSSARAEASASATATRAEAELELVTRRVSLRFAREEAEGFLQLESTGDVSRIAAAHARAEVEKAEIAVDSQAATLARLAQDALRDDADRAATLAERQRELAAREGERGVRLATLERLEQARELCRVRAPAAGRVGELARLTPGSFVHAGESLGAIVSEARLAVEADYAPADALGKVRLGQRGELVLAGFPRAQFGALEVQVERIANETRDGRIRVELVLLAPERARVPLEHGLPGAVSIEVERTAPVTLLLRAVGSRLDGPGAR
jgi:multidrug resistance efflux pump